LPELEFERGRAAAGVPSVIKHIPIAKMTVFKIIPG
jgi:hypothetical protein